jgi:hypothetical protein
MSGSGRAVLLFDVLAQEGDRGAADRSGEYDPDHSRFARQ